MASTPWTRLRSLNSQCASAEHSPAPEAHDEYRSIASRDRRRCEPLLKASIDRLLISRRDCEMLIVGPVPSFYDNTRPPLLISTATSHHALQLELARRHAPTLQTSATYHDAYQHLSFTMAPMRFARLPCSRMPQSSIPDSSETTFTAPSAGSSISLPITPYARHLRPLPLVSQEATPFLSSVIAESQILAEPCGSNRRQRRGG